MGILWHHGLIVFQNYVIRSFYANCCSCHQICVYFLRRSLFLGLRAAGNAWKATTAFHPGMPFFETFQAQHQKSMPCVWLPLRLLRFLIYLGLLWPVCKLDQVAQIGLATMATFPLAISLKVGPCGSLGTRINLPSWAEKNGPNSALITGFFHAAVTPHFAEGENTRR